MESGGVFHKTLRRSVASPSEFAAALIEEMGQRPISRIHEPSYSRLKPGVHRVPRLARRIQDGTAPTRRPAAFTIEVVVRPLQYCLDFQGRKSTAVPRAAILRQKAGNR